jgi:DNA-binding CsgD family transcriptional regulator
MGLFYGFGAAVGADELAADAVKVAEIAAARNPGVASFGGVALSLRGLASQNLELLDRSAQIIARSPRPVLRGGVAEAYGMALLKAHRRSPGLAQLDRAWDEYSSMGAWAFRASVQRAMHEAGDRRAKWALSNQSATGWSALTAAERRVVAMLIATGHTNKSAAAELTISVDTVNTQLRVVYAKLGIRSRVQLANILSAAAAK